MHRTAAVHDAAAVVHDAAAVVHDTAAVVHRTAARMTTAVVLNKNVVTGSLED